jgi:hypothetical protein
MLPTIHHDLEPQKTKGRAGAIFLLIIILVAAASGAVYYWQKTEAQKLATATEEKVRNEMQQKIDSVENKANDLTNKLNETETKLSELEKVQLNNSLCTIEPIPNETGYSTYPIAEKYKDLRHLGELFTAADCNNPERLSGVFGVKGENYIIGANMSLKDAPSTEMLNTLKSIGFYCKDKSIEVNCKQWELKNTVKLNDFLKLKNFYQEIIASSCANCG